MRESMSDDARDARIKEVSGSLVIAEAANAPFRASLRLFESARVGKNRLLGEIIEIRDAEIAVQLYENAAGLSAGEEVLFTGEGLSVDLGPGFLGEAVNGVGISLGRAGETELYLERGLWSRPAAPRAERQWRFRPSVREGERAGPGGVLGTVAEGPFLHRVMVPPFQAPAEVEWVAPEGDYTVREAVCRLSDGTALSMTQRWEIRVPRPAMRRLSPSGSFVTGQSALDTLFPLILGGTAALSGEPGTGKTLLLQSLARCRGVDVVVYIVCGERGAEAAEVLEELSKTADACGEPSLHEPSWPRSSPMERTVLIVGASGMPLAAQEASVCLGMTLAEYYRDMGYSAAVLLDSASGCAEALRETGARLRRREFPEYGVSRLSACFERAGRAELLGTPAEGARRRPQIGSVTLIGTESETRGASSFSLFSLPPLAAPGAFWRLDRRSARACRFPALDFSRSYSRYKDAFSGGAAEDGPEPAESLKPQMGFLRAFDKKGPWAPGGEAFKGSVLSRANAARLYKEGSSEITGLAGPLLFVSDMRGVGCGERVSVETDGQVREGQVLSVSGDLCVVQVFEGTEGLSTGRTTVWMERDAVKAGVGEALRGQVLNGRGLPVDGGELYGAEDFLPVDGLPLNPVIRAAPTAAIETGLSALDITAPLMLGQKFALFAPPGLPGLEMAARIADSALIRSGRSLVSGKEKTPLVVFVGMGLAGHEADCFLEFFNRENREDKAAGGVFLLNRAGDPVAERLLIPRVALTAAEYFAFHKGHDVLVVMADMFRYGQAFLETASFGDRRCFDLASDLAGLCGRGGCLAGRPGSVTQLFVAGTPADHPFAELLGRLTEGRIVLDRRLHAKGIYPPIDILGSRFRIFRMSGKAVGRGRTIDGHEALAMRLRSAYAEHRKPAEMYRAFTESFEKDFIAQKSRRTFAQSEAIAREVLSLINNEVKEAAPPCGVWGGAPSF